MLVTFGCARLKWLRDFLACGVSPPTADRVVVTVRGLTGDVLLESVNVFSIEELEELSAMKLKAPRCRIISANGNLIACANELLKSEEQGKITAVAQDVSPLLQLVGLQNQRGELDERFPHGET